jgi:hypothetical protein
VTFCPSQYKPLCPLSTPFGPVWGCSCYRHLFVVGVINGREREKVSNLLWKGRMELGLVELTPPTWGVLLPLLYVKGKVQVTRERGREKESERKRERSKEEEGLWSHVVLHPPYVGPTGPIDDDGDGSTSRTCSPLAPHARVVSRSWRPILSWRAAWSTGTPDGSHTRVRQHSVGPPDVVGDVSS